MGVFPLDYVGTILMILLVLYFSGSLVISFFLLFFLLINTYLFIYVYLYICL
jgi:hypothetical protein